MWLSAGLCGSSHGAGPEVRWKGLVGKGPRTESGARWGWKPGCPGSSGPRGGVKSEAEGEGWGLCSEQGAGGPESQGGHSGWAAQVSCSVQKLWGRPGVRPAYSVCRALTGGAGSEALCRVPAPRGSSRKKGLFHQRLLEGVTSFLPSGARWRKVRGAACIWERHQLLCKQWLPLGMLPASPLSGCAECWLSGS